MKNSDDKLTINYNTLDDYYDIYVNGLNAVASGTLYITGDSGVIEESPILINGEDSGYTGKEYDFDVISDYCVKVNQFQPNDSGEIDFIFVEDGNLHQLSEMYDYGYHKILINTEDTFGVLPIASFSEVIATDYSSSDPEEVKDPWVVLDGSTDTYVSFGYNVFNRHLIFKFEEAKTVNALKIYAQRLSDVNDIVIEYKLIDDGDNDNNWISSIPEETVKYDEIRWENEWLTVNFIPTGKVESIRLSFKGFVETIQVNAVEFYAMAQPYEESPVEEAVYSWGEPKDQNTSSSWENMVDGNLSTETAFGYNELYQDCYLYLKRVTKIGTIRIYFTALPNSEWVTLSYYTPEFNGSYIDMIYREPHNDVTNQWIEYDLSSLGLSTDAIKIQVGTGFISEAKISGFEILPW